MGTRENGTLAVYNQLHTMIENNQVRPGEKFNQVQLSVELGVSRTPIVKALHKLASEGLVDNIPQRGFYVHVPNLKEIYELLTIREALDAVVSKDVAKHRTVEQANVLRELWAPFDAKWPKEKWDEPEVKDAYLMADRHFHKSVYAWCSLDIVHRMNNIFQILHRTFLVGLLRNGNETFTEHFAIAQAIINRDAEEAASLAAIHNGNTVKVLGEVIERLSAMGIDCSTLDLDKWEHYLIEG